MADIIDLKQFLPLDFPTRPATVQALVDEAREEAQFSDLELAELRYVFGGDLREYRIARLKEQLKRVNTLLRELLSYYAQAKS